MKARWILLGLFGAGVGIYICQKSRLSSHKQIASFIPSLLVFPASNTSFLDIPPRSVAIGQGYNSATAEPVGTNVVQYDPDLEERELITTGVRNVDFTLQQIRSVEELKSVLNISAAASFGWGVFSGDSTFNFVRSASFTKYSNFLYLRVLVENRDKVLRKSLLTDTSLQRMKERRFLEFGGDEYIFGKRLGGSFNALIQFTSQSQSEQTKVEATLGATVGGIINGEAAVASAISTLKTISEIKIHVNQTGGGGDIPDTADALIAAARKFPSTITPQDVMVYLTRRYNTVENLPRDFPSFEVLRNLQRTLNIIAGYLDEAYRMSADLRYVQQHQEEFEGNLDAVSPAIMAIEDIIRDLIDTAEDCKARFPEIPSPPSRPPFPILMLRRKDTGSPIPLPSRPQWINVDINLEGTFLGNIPSGKIGTVDVRGMWMPIYQQQRCVGPTGWVRQLYEYSVLENGQFCVLIKAVNGNGEVVRTVRFDGRPAIIPEPDVRVYVSMADIDARLIQAWTPRQCTPPMQAILYVT